MRWPGAMDYLVGQRDGPYADEADTLVDGLYGHCPCLPAISPARTAARTDI
jgi:hypothetical protein